MKSNHLDEKHSGSKRPHSKPVDPKDLEIHDLSPLASYVTHNDEKEETVKPSIITPTIKVVTPKKIAAPKQLVIEPIEEDKRVSSYTHTLSQLGYKVDSQEVKTLSMLADKLDRLVVETQRAAHETRQKALTELQYKDVPNEKEQTTIALRAMKVTKPATPKADRLNKNYLKHVTTLLFLDSNVSKEASKKLSESELRDAELARVLQNQEITHFFKSAVPTSKAEKEKQMREDEELARKLSQQP